MAAEAPTVVTQTAFRLAEKKYRRAQDTPHDLADVVDASSYTEEDTQGLRRIDIARPDEWNKCEWLCAAEQLQAFTHVDHEGLILIPGALDPAAQAHWIAAAVGEWTVGGRSNRVSLGEAAMTEWNAEEMDKIRWISQGYHYQWTEREYREDKFGPMASILTDLGTAAASGALGWDNYAPEAVIVNYYRKDTRMGGHADDAEIDMESPIVSISLGCDGIFLIGGETRDTTPTAFRLRSGDVMLMSGPSRKCIHGLPRILEGTVPDAVVGALSALSANSKADQAVVDYIAGTRVNINVRQVYPDSGDDIVAAPDGPALLSPQRRKYK